MLISYVIPTRGRPGRLARTLDALARRATTRAEVVVVDDAAPEPLRLPSRAAGALPVTVVRLDTRHGAAARNAGARIASGRWLVMLDDDSYPVNDGVLRAIADAPARVAAIGARITLAGDRHEDGGLPEVFVGCGVAIRRDVFLAAGGYDRAFHYYVEEYDLCARVLRAGWRVRHDWRFHVHHEKDAAGRDMDTIVARLVRNGGWVMARYAPARLVASAIDEVVERCAEIAGRTASTAGFARGRAELAATVGRQPRRPLTLPQWRRFTGAAHVRATLRRRPELRDARVALVERGKNAAVVARVLTAHGSRVVNAAHADVRVIGTLSPGPLMDAWRRHPDAVRPWTPHLAEASVARPTGAR